MYSIQIANESKILYLTPVDFINFNKTSITSTDQNRYNPLNKIINTIKVTHVAGICIDKDTAYFP